MIDMNDFLRWVSACKQVAELHTGGLAATIYLPLPVALQPGEPWGRVPERLYGIPVHAVTTREACLPGGHTAAFVDLRQPWFPRYYDGPMPPAAAKTLHVVADKLEHIGITPREWECIVGALAEVGGPGIRQELGGLCNLDSARDAVSDWIRRRTDEERRQQEAAHLREVLERQRREEQERIDKMMEAARPAIARNVGLLEPHLAAHPTCPLGPHPPGTRCRSCPTEIP